MDSLTAVRQAFEAWAARPRSITWKPDLTRNGDHYVNEAVDIAWGAWQGRGEWSLDGETLVVSATTIAERPGVQLEAPIGPVTWTPHDITRLDDAIAKRWGRANAADGHVPIEGKLSMEVGGRVVPQRWFTRSEVVHLLRENMSEATVRVTWRSVATCTSGDSVLWIENRPAPGTPLYTLS